MSYSDEATVAKYMPHLPASGEAGYTNTSALITQAITDADAIVDAHIAVNYAVPLDPVPPLVRYLSTQIAIHHAYKLIYPGDNIATNTYSEKYEAWEENAYKMLEKIQNDELILTDTNGSLVALRSGGEAIRGTHADYPSVFNMDNAENWGVDADLLEEINDDRS